MRVVSNKEIREGLLVFARNVSTCFQITVYVYGDRPAPFTLYADDGRTLDYAAGRQNQIHLTWQNGEGRLTTEGDYHSPDRYKVTAWQRR